MDIGEVERIGDRVQDERRKELDELRRTREFERKIDETEKVPVPEKAT